MASATADLCRITVVGPDRRADLAVPASMPLAELLPQLRRFVVRVDTSDAQSSGWVLQRLGEAPFLPAATPETAGWLDGEILHLARVQDALPELDFDDVADAVASSIDRQGDRWSPVAQRRLFLGVGVGGVLGAVAVLWALPGAIASASIALTALLLVIGAVRVARTSGDGVVLRLAGVLACAAGAAAGVRLVTASYRASSPTDPVTAWVVAGALGAAAFAALLLGVRATPLAPRIPSVPSTAVLIVSSAALATALLHGTAGLTLGDAGAVISVVLLAITLIAPRLAARAAGIRMPQLPRSAEEMEIDIEPLPAADMADRTTSANGYLSAGIVGIAAYQTPALWLVAQLQDWSGLLLAAVLAALIAMRAREALAVPQRVALVVAACSGLAAVVTVLLIGAAPPVRILVAAMLLVGAAFGVATARRPLSRRLRPRWRHAVLILEGLLTAACVPLLLGTIGVYAWARGLGG